MIPLLYIDGDTMSVTITFKVPEVIKKKMKRFRVNWSRILREFLIEKIRELEAKENIGKVRELIEDSEGVPKGFSINSLREDRDSH